MIMSMMMVRMVRMMMIMMKRLASRGRSRCDDGNNHEDEYVKEEDDISEDY